MGLGRTLGTWFGSFLVVALMLSYSRVPLVPLVLGGGVTLVWTIARFRRSQRSSRPSQPR